MVAGGDTAESCLKDNIDWRLENLFFTTDIVGNWNSLSDNCVSCTTLNNFKSRMLLHGDWKSNSTVRS